jgi:hypothetical protein
MSRRALIRVTLAWALTHVPLFLLVLLVVSRAQDVRFYAGWAQILSGGAFPYHDPQWQYPPGAGALLWLPTLFGDDYDAAFHWLAFTADAAIMAMLLWAAHRRRAGTAGPWLWVVAMPLLGSVAVYSRYDVLVAVFAVAAVLVMAARPALGGVLAGLGAVIKVWPGLILFGAPPRRRGGLAALGAAVATVAVVLTAFGLTMAHALSFVTSQAERGVEIESIFAMPFLIGRHLGWPGRVEFRYGSVEYVGPYVWLAADAALVVTVLAFGWLLVWRARSRRWTPATVADASLTATLLFIVVSRVISPQYLVWVLALGAVTLCGRGSSQRPVVVLLLVVTGLTQLEFPIVFEGIKAGQPLPSAVLLVRDILLVVMTVYSMRRLWRASVSTPEPESPAPPDVPSDPADGAGATALSPARARSRWAPGPTP